MAAFTATRTIINTLFRKVYPFLSEFGRGLGIEFSRVASSLSWRSLPGLFSPFFASLADSWGRKTGILLGVFLFSIGLMIVVFWPTYIGFVFMLIFTALGKFTFDPSIRAYLGDNVPYGRRGFVMAITVGIRSEQSPSRSTPSNTSATSSRSTYKEGTRA